MEYALFFVPLSVPREQLLAGLLQALQSYDLPPPPDRVLLSTPARAEAAGAWVFALGTTRPSERRLHHGTFVDSMGYRFPVGFMSRADPEPGEQEAALATGEAGGIDPRLYAAPEEFFVYYDGTSQLEITSYGALLGGAVQHLTVDLPQRGYTNAELLAEGARELYARGWTANVIGRAQSGLKVDAGALEGAELLALTDSGLTPLEGGRFADLMFAGIGGDDPFPSEFEEEIRIGVRPEPTVAPRPKLSLEEALELENEAAELRSEGGDLKRARALLEQVLESYPKSNRAHGLYVWVLVELGADGLDAALEARFEAGVSVRSQGDVSFLNVIDPARDFALTLLSQGEFERARDVIERAERALSPTYRHHLGRLREQLADYEDLPTWFTLQPGTQRQIMAEFRRVWLERLRAQPKEARLEAARHVKAALKSPKLKAEREALLAALLE